MKATTKAIMAPSPSAPMQVARQLVDEVYTRHGQLILRDHSGDFYLYDGTAWPEVDRRIVRADAYKYLENAFHLKGEDTEPWDPTRYKIDNVLDAMRAVTILETGTPPTWTERREDDPPAAEVVSMANGLLHVPTRTLVDHTPRYFTHHALPFRYEPDAPEPRGWLAFLEQLWSHDPSSIRALQEVFGYILGWDTRLQKIFLLVGPRRGGKGTIGRVLTGLLGPHNVAAPTMAGLGQNFGLQPLISKPLALISDARLSGRADRQVVVERLLSISGEDSLTIDRKYKEPWTGRLPTRFMILTNELPRLSDSSGALASRFIIFVLTRSFLGKEDPNLTDKLLAEAPGIFNWSLEGLDRLQERGRFLAPESGRDAVQQLEDLSSPVSAFIREECEVGAEAQVAVDDLWDAWKTWCEVENRNPGTKAVFGRNLNAALPTIHKARPREDGDRTSVYTGIGLVGKTMAGHRDHRDQGERSRVWTRVGDGSRSRQEPNDDGAGHSGHGNPPPDAELTEEDRQYLLDEREGMQMEDPPVEVPGLLEVDR